PAGRAGALVGWPRDAAAAWVWPGRPAAAYGGAATGGRTGARPGLHSWALPGAQRWAGLAHVRASARRKAYQQRSDRDRQRHVGCARRPAARPAERLGGCALERLYAREIGVGSWGMVVLMPDNPASKTQTSLEYALERFALGLGRQGLVQLMMSAS